jgi:hypothetical protein
VARWGEVWGGDHPWGGGVPSGIDPDPVYRGAKLGTRFLGHDPDGLGFATLATDRSQEGIDMGVTGSSITEDPAPRYDRSHPRTLAARITTALADGGAIFTKQDGIGGFDCRWRKVGSEIQAEVNGVTVGTLVLPGIGAAAQTYLVGWLSIPDPDSSTGGTLSWLVAFNEDTAIAARSAFGHAAQASSTGRATWGDDGNGTSVFDGTISMVGVHDRRMTLRELYQDWVFAPAEPSTEFVEERQPLPVDLSTGVHDEDELHGPAAAWGAFNHRQLRRRLATALHVRYLDVQIREGTTDANWIAPPGEEGGYLWRMGWLHVWPVPAGCNEARVELHLRSWVTVGSSVPVGLRCYSMNRPPVALGVGPPEPYEQYFVGQVVDRDDTPTGIGSHVVLGRLPLAVAQQGIRKGKTYIGLAFAFDPLDQSANDAAASIVVSDLHVVPGFRHVAGGLGFGGGG